MSSLTKVSSMPKCFPSGLSLPGQCRIGTQRLAARHTYGWGANSPSEPKFSSLPARTSTRPPPLRHPSCWRRAHSQGEGPHNSRHPSKARPSPLHSFCPAIHDSTPSECALGSILKESQSCTDAQLGNALLRHHGYPPRVPSINNHPRYRSNYYAN